MQQLSNPHLTWHDLTLGEPETDTWLQAHPHLSSFAADLLQSGQSRPRVTEHADGIHIVLRGINMNEGQDAEDMVSLRIWTNADHIITCHWQALQSLGVVRHEWSNNQLESPLAFILRVVELLNDRIAIVVSDLEAQLDQLEATVDSTPLDVSNTTVNARRTIAHLRRFLAPQREALRKLHELAKRQNADPNTSRRLYEEADRLTHLLEELDLAKDQASLLREQAITAIAQQQNARLYVFSVLSVIFMPLTFISGLLGMNVAGIPGTTNSTAFWLVAGCSLLYIVTLLIYFKRKRWL